MLSHKWVILYEEFSLFLKSVGRGLCSFRTFGLASYLVCCKFIQAIGKLIFPEE